MRGRAKALSLAGPCKRRFAHVGVVRDELTFCHFAKQKRFGGDYGHYRDSRIQDGKTAHGVSGSAQFYFAENQLLAELETSAKQQGLQFIDELIFENGAVYKGKLLHYKCPLFLKDKLIFFPSDTI